MSLLTIMIFVDFRYDACVETRPFMKMPKIAGERSVCLLHVATVVGVLIVACALLTQPANAEDPPNTGERFHPLLNSKYWAKVGAFLASRDVSLSARGAALVDPFSSTARIDFDSETGLDDESDLLIVEFGWHFGKKWDFALQHFRSSRHSQKELQESIEWKDVVYEAGATIKAQSSLKITRLFFSRRFWDKGPHDLRLGAGLHLIDASVSISGEATLEDTTTEFQANVVSASFPFPDIGAWYRYSINDRWLIHTRVDWLSASTEDYSGGIWNVSAGVDFALTKNLGFGLAYQFFEINGSVKEDTWRGDLDTSMQGITLSLDGFW